MNKKKELVLPILFLLCFCFLLVPQTSKASAASKPVSVASKPTPVTKLAGVSVRMYAKQGDGWFVAKTKKIDKDGVLMYKNIVSGWGKVELVDKRKSAALAGQTFTSKFKMLDEKGRRIKKKTPVDIYAKIHGTKTFIATMYTDKKGWLVVPHAMIGIESYMNVRGHGESLSSKHHETQPRVKVESKMDDGKWFVALQKKLDSDGVLTIKNAGSGKTKFTYVASDGKKIALADLVDDLNQKGKLSDKFVEKFKASDFAGKTFEKPFILKVKVVDKNGRNIKRPTNVKMTVYLKHRTLEGTMRTNHEGWLTIKGVPVDIKTKMDVDD